MSFSKARLARMRETMAGYVERGEMPGLVTLVCHEGEVHVDAIGTLAYGSKEPMERDTLFRIASLTKPITAAGVMILVEECRLRLDDPVDPFLPELADRQVLRGIESALDDTVPAGRQITVRHLLTSCLGFGSVMAPPDTFPIQTAVREGKLGGDGPPLPAEAPTSDEYIRRLGALPLMNRPGEKWLYHTSSDVQGVLIERVTGQTLGEFLRERIFEPLGMEDTSFSVPADKVSRLATSYCGNEVYDDRENSQWTRPTFHSGGGGLVSTVDDYLAFCRMMLEKGKPGILSRASVELMTSDQLTADQRAEAGIFFGEHASWGFGMSVDVRRDNLYTVPGRFGWDGGLGTSGYTDPANEMIGILMTQQMMTSPDGPPVYKDFWTSAYQAIED